MTEAKAVKCVCGTLPHAIDLEDDGWQMRCNGCYWQGPPCESESEAVAAWNAVMRPRPVVTEHRGKHADDWTCSGKTIAWVSGYDENPVAVASDGETHRPGTREDCRAWLIAKLRTAGFDVRTEGK